MILVRVRSVNEKAIELANLLHRQSGLPVTFIVDGRHGIDQPAASGTITMTLQGDRELGLYSPHDVGWRCGDYCYYYARAEFSNVDHFWLIEDDVRIGGDAELFFERFDGRNTADLLATYLRTAEPDWWWYAHARASDIRPLRSFFPVTRLSSRAIDHLLAMRRKHSKRWLRRLLWPNDEVFVATTLSCEGVFQIRDFNAFENCYYDEGSFGYFLAISPESVEAAGPPRLYHPVLTQEQRLARSARIASSVGRAAIQERAKTAIFKRINALTRWS